MLHARTLEHALRRALSFLTMVLDDPAGELRLRDGLAEIVLTDRDAPAPGLCLSHLLADPDGRDVLADRAAHPADAGRFRLPGTGKPAGLPAILRRAGGSASRTAGWSLPRAIWRCR